MYIFPSFSARREKDARIEEALRIGDCFDVLLHNKSETCPGTFETLKSCGIELKDDVYILVQFDSGVLWTAELLLHQRPVPLAEQIFASWGGSFNIHLFTSGGCLYALLVFQEPFRRERFQGQLRACCDRLMNTDEGRGLRILISRDERGIQGIFHAANSLRHGLDYLRFFDESPGLSFINLRKQTALGDGAELAVYQRLTKSLAERLRDDGFRPDAAAREIIETLRAHSACSIESLHSQMQSFNLIFLEHLRTHALVDEAFLNRQMIRRHIMEGDREKIYLENLERTLHMLHLRCRELRTRYDVDHLNRVRAYVERHIASMDLSVSFVADHFHVNRSQLTKQFRDYYGQSLAEFIHTTRLDLAMLLIELHPSRSIEQIAGEAGYYSLSTMYRAFQKNGLCTPAQYRQQFKGIKKDEVRQRYF